MKLVLLLALTHLQINQISAIVDPDQHKSIEELIQSRGFDVETHYVTTADGYILTLHRLVDSNVSIGLPEDEYYHYETVKRPLLVQHGLFGTSIDFLLSSPFLVSNTSQSGDNLGFALHMTDRYDVWFGNARGNYYSRRHLNYTDKDAAFWRFSFDHMAEYDLPAMIDYVCNATTQKSLGYVAFSQGTTSMFTLLSLRPEYATIVTAFIALAPMTTVADVRSPVPAVPMRTLAQMALFFTEQPREFEVPSWLNGIFWKSAHLNRSRISVYNTHSPSAIGTWELRHWAQLAISRRFARFDYASEQANTAAYGQAQVPDIPLEKIPPTSRIALFRSTHDDMSSVPDQERLIDVLTQNGVQLIDYVVPDPHWTHTDFLHGIDAGRLIYDKVIEVLDRLMQ